MSEHLCEIDAKNKFWFVQKYQNNQTIDILKKSINDIIDEKNVNYQDIFNGEQQDQTRIYKDSFYVGDQSIYETHPSKSIGILNSTLSKKVEEIRGINCLGTEYFSEQGKYP
jgi:uncharacterized protein (DUF2461 family)